MMGRVNVPSSSRLLKSVLCLAAFGLSATGAWGASCVVSTTADSGTGSLRACLSGLTTGTAVDTNSITFSVTGTITLASSLPAIANGVTITGPGANQLTIDGAGQYQIMSVNGSGIAVSISGLTFANGKASGSGGAINLATGTLTVSNSAFSANSSGAFGGAVAGQGGTLIVTGSTFTQNVAANSGGAISSNVTSTVTNNTFYGNSSSSGGSGGAIYVLAAANVTNNTFNGNSSNYGGAISVASSGSLTADNNLFAGNSANGGGAGIYNGNGGTATADHNVYYKNLTGSSEDDCKTCTGNTNATSASSNPLTLPFGYYGGTTETYLPQPGSAAICAGSSTAANLPTSDQRGFAVVNACVDAGAVQTNYVQVQNNSDTGGSCPGSSCRLRTAIAAANTAGYGDIDFASGVTSITGASTLDLSGTTGINIIGNGANKLSINGGGSSSNFSVFTVDANVPAVLYGLTISSGNSAGQGGGIDNLGNLTLLSSAMTGNSAGYGGGIAGASGSTLLVMDSTISGNTGTNEGGGLYLNSGSTTEIIESTVAGANSSPAGAGIFSSGTLTVVNSTIAGNSAGTSGQGGGINVHSGTASLANSIVSGNTVGSSGTGSNVSGTYVDNLGNVIGGNTDATNTQLGGTGAAITLSSLGYSPTSTVAVQTQVPVPGNPAICGGKSANVPSSITTDERGQAISPNACASGSVDAGAVQTNYSISFTTNPPSTVTVDEGFGAAVTLDESGQPASASGVNIPLTLSSGTLSGTTTQATNSGVATYSGLSATFGSALTLNASVVLSGTVKASATSSSFNVTAAPSTVSLQSSSTSTAVGQPVTLTTTVSPSATNLVGPANIIAMTGSVTYKAGTQALTCSSDTFQFSQSSGTATDTCVTSDLPAGSQVSLTATYSGDGNYQASQPSTAVHVSVSQGSATTSLTCTSTDPTSPNCATSVSLNATVTFTETVSAPSGGITPTGTVTFTANGSTIGGCGSNGKVTLNNGTATCSTSSLKANTYSIVAAYSGDSNYSKTNDTLTLVIGQTGTTTTLASSSPGNTSTVNQSVTFTATIGPANANPALSGTVTIIDTSNNNAQICAGNVDPTTQQFSCSTQGLSLGSHKIQAKYGSDNNYAGSTSTLLTQQVNAGTATIPSFSSSSNPSIVNSNVTFTATVSVPSGPTSPVGYVHFTANSSTITGCDKVTLTLSSPGATSGTAQCTTSSLAASTTAYTIGATFTDTNGNFTSASNSLQQTVSAAATTVTIAAAPNTTTVNSPVTYTVTATAATTVYPLTGTVQITDNGTLVCSGLTLTQASGSQIGTNSSCVENNLTAGVHTITATYNLSGSDPNNGSGNGSTTVPVAPATTSVMVMSSLNPSIVANPQNDSDTVTFTATVTSTGTISVPLQGSVVFTENGLVLQGAGCPSPAPVNSAGQASCTTSSLPAGADTILAVYSNDPNYTGSSGYLMSSNQVQPQMVQDYSLVVSSTPPVEVSQGYTSANDLFSSQTISVVPLAVQGFSTQPGAPLALACPTPVVKYSPASSPTPPTCTLASNSLAISKTGAQGAVGIVVDATHASAGIYTVNVNGTDPTTGLIRSSSFDVIVRAASTPLTVVSGATTGNTATLTFLVPDGITVSNLACQSVSGPNLTGSLSPSSLGITCAFNPTSVTNSTGSLAGVQVTLTAGTSGTTSTTAAITRHNDLWLAGLLGLPFFGLIGLIRGRKSRDSVFFRLVVIAVICVMAFQAVGCGGSFTTQPSNTSGGGKTPPGVYQVLIVGSGSDGQTYQAVLQLNVQL